MEYDVLEARLVRDFVVWLRFRDGTTGEVDLRDALRGPVFQPLHDPEYFKQFRADRGFDEDFAISTSGSSEPERGP